MARSDGGRPARGGRRDPRPRLPAERGRDVRLCDASVGLPLGACRRRTPNRPRRPQRPDARGPGRCPDVPAGGRRRASSGVLDAAAADARATHNEADRAACEAATVVDGEPWDGPGVHPGRSIAHPPTKSSRRGDRHHRCRQLLRLGRPRLPLPTTWHVPRPDVRRDGLRAAGGHRRGDRASRPAGGGARRRRRVRDDDGRARDRRPRGRAVDRDRVRQPALRHDPDAPGPRGAAGQGSRDRPRPGGLRSDRPGLGARGVRVERTPRSNRRSAQALAADAPTVIQVALDRRWVRPSAASTRPDRERRDAPDLPPRPGRRRGPPDRAAPYAPPSLAERASSTARTGPGDGRHREPPLP